MDRSVVVALAVGPESGGDGIDTDAPVAVVRGTSESTPAHGATVRPVKPSTGCAAGVTILRGLRSMSLALDG